MSSRKKKIILILSLLIVTVSSYGQEINSNSDVKEPVVESGEISNKDTENIEEIPEDGEVLVEVKTKSKSDYLDGIIKNKELYIEKDRYLSLVEYYKNAKLNNGKKLRIPKDEMSAMTIEVSGKEFVNLKEINKIFKPTYEKVDYGKSEVFISVPWKLDYEIEKDRLDARKYLKKDGEEDPFLKEEWKKFTPGLLSLGYSRTDGEGSDNEQSTYFNYVNNIYYGSFNTNITVEDSDEDGTETTLDYAYWERDIDRNKVLTFGDTYITSPFNVSDTNGSVVGASIGLENSWDSKMRVTQKSVSGYVPSGTIVELYENGVLKDVQTVSGGQYKFNVELANGSKEYVIKKYMANGEILTENVTLAGDEKVLPKGVYDYQIAGGGVKDKESEGTYFVEGRYGLIKDTTISAGVFNLYNENYESKDFTTGGINNLIDLPFAAGSINNNFNYAGDGDNNSMYRYHSWFTKGPVTFGYRYEDYKELDVSYQGTYEEFQNIYTDLTLPDGSTIKIGKANYTMSNNMDNYEDDEYDEYGNKYTYGRDEAGDQYEDYYANWNKSYRAFNFNLGAKDSNNETSDEREKTLSPGVTYMFSPNSFMYKLADSVSYSMEFSDDSEQNTTYNVSVNKNDGGEWEWTLDYSNDEEGGDERFGVRVSYTPGRTAKYSVDIRKDDNGTQVTSSVETMVHLGADNKPKISYPETMGKGLIKGKVYVDRDGDGEFDVGKDEILKNSKIVTSSDDSYTNGSGIYTLAGVNTSAITDVRAVTEDKYLPYSVKNTKLERVKLNPGGEYNLDFTYLPNVAVASTLEFEKGFFLDEVNDILTETDIEFRNLRTGEIIKSAWENSDLLIVTIPVGKYAVKINYTGENEVSIDKKEFLLELVDMEESDLTFKVEKGEGKVYSLKALKGEEELYSLLDTGEEGLSIREEEIKKLKKVSMTDEERKKLKQVSMNEEGIKKSKKISMITKGEE